ncbi:MAG: hypothetical protein U9O24_03570 [Campylobacterota bacterium]|nr:hypothetical protein [Campylobacterota bacterium]
MKKIVLSVAAVAMMGSNLYAGKNAAPVDAVVAEIPQVDVIVEDTSYGINSLYTAGFKVGTLGLGAELSVPLGESFSVRASVNGFTYSKDDVYEDDGDEIAYDASVDLLTVGLLLDYYPIESSQFRLTAGAYYNGNGLDAILEPTNGVYDINGVSYDAGDIGSLNADIEFDKVAPYVGIGWGNKGTEAGWGFSIDVGAMYHGEGQLNADVTRGADIPTDNGGVNDQLFEDIVADVETKRVDAEDDMSDYQWYPVIMVGVTYTF